MDALYPTELSPHPQPGALMAYRDGLFGRRPQAPYGTEDVAFENGVLGPVGGAAGMGATPGLDAGALRSFRDGIFNFPRELQQHPHPVTAYQDGIFGGASLGQDAAAETPTSVDAEGGAGPAPSNGAVTPVTLDLTSPADLAETVSFMRDAAAGCGIQVRDSSDISDVVSDVVAGLGAQYPAQASDLATFATKRVGSKSYPTAALLLSIATIASGECDYFMDVATYPKLAAFFETCLINVFVGPPPNSILEAAALTDQTCPIRYPEPGLSTAMIYGGAAVVGVGLVWLVLRR